MFSAHIDLFTAPVMLNRGFSHEYGFTSFVITKHALQHWKFWFSQKLLANYIVKQNVYVLMFLALQLSQVIVEQVVPNYPA